MPSICEKQSRGIRASATLFICPSSVVSGGITYASMRPMYGNDESNFGVMLTEAKPIFTCDYDAEEEFKNSHFWFELVLWSNPWEQ